MVLQAAADPSFVHPVCVLPVQFLALHLKRVDLVGYFTQFLVSPITPKLIAAQLVLISGVKRLNFGGDCL